MSVTYNKKNKKRARKHGFLMRMATKSGRNIITDRRRKKRSRLTVSEE
jgi:large subunit ribosomal protein L34